LLAAGLPAFLAGVIEDLTKRVSVRVRLFASIASALGASLTLGATVNSVDIWGVDALLAWAPFALLVTAVVVAGGINAINIIDGFNGLAAATVVIMLAALGMVGWQVGDQLVTELALLGLGAAMGFLLVNFPSGRIFLGDGGAYFLGFWVAEVGVLLLVRNESVNAWQVLAICAYPVIEVLFSIYRRRVVRQASPGSPDGLHLHTLVYRRLVSRLVPRDSNKPWKRNAAVACITAPWIAAAAALSVAVGGKLVGAIAITIAQVVVYIVFYARLVRGRWSIRDAVQNLRAEDAEAQA
jgi:UDP-N-acetylmuramyl pentapeptide phosphotransferase/UDP-N-acetylglucosamine-1-phosphate transferase